MKKILALAAAAIVALGASAQNMYVGGSVGFTSTKSGDAKTTNINFMPEIGYNLSDNMALGTVVGVEYQKEGDIKSTLVNFDPYFRYTFFQAGNFSIFCDLSVDLGFGKTKETFTDYDDNGNEFKATFSSKTATTYGIGLKPGMAFNVSEKFGFVAHVGFLGYKGANQAAKLAGEPQVCGLDLSGNNLSFGFYYNF